MSYLCILKLKTSIPTSKSYLLLLFDRYDIAGDGTCETQAVSTRNSAISGAKLSLTVLVTRLVLPDYG